MKETIKFCGKDHKDRFSDFFKSKLGVKMLGHQEVFQVRIVECSDEEKATHWSWWDNEDKEFQFTHPLKTGVTICFPYAIEVYEKKGEGKLMPVFVEMI